ncbi:MAG TPA: sulfurtransferase-like selenium metabolism protein YedF [Acidobacteriota bacterium]|nr:sulfurtransferase-like selenium metabolism protein YedF [Acidobacteriota bacterium]HNU01117.1 sulfurtransferase-like selenium metabolism protein YedF [Acidobacteriota bacterium]
MQVLYLNSDQMGAGDAELGRKLLQGFLKKIVDSEIPLDFVVCVNSGVFLTTADGEALESIRALESRGAKVASCGTCLDHYGRRAALRVGVVGAMAETVELLASATRVIRP